MSDRIVFDEKVLDTLDYILDFPYITIENVRYRILSCYDDKLTVRRT